MLELWAWRDSGMDCIQKILTGFVVL